MRKRSEKDIWQGLHEFILKEHDGKKTPKLPPIVQRLTKEKVNAVTYPVVRNLLSHQRLNVVFHTYQVDKLPESDAYIEVPARKNALPGVPQVILRFLEQQPWFKR